MMVRLRDVLAILIDEQARRTGSVDAALFKENINVNNAYGFVLESRKKAVFVVDVDQIEKAL